VGADEARFREAERRYWASEGLAPTEEWLTLRRTGGRVRVQIVGDGRPVLFVHGVNNAGTSWGSLAARLTDVRCVLLDRPGCGLSERLPQRFVDVASFGRYAESLAGDVLDALEVTTADVVCTSLGGYFGLRAAAAHPDRVRRLVELGWTVGAPNGTFPLWMRMTGMRSLGRLTARLPANERMVRAMLARIGLRQALESGRFTQEGVDWYQALLNHTDTLRNELWAMPPLVHPIRGMDDDILFTGEELGSIAVPSSFLWGAEDPFGGEDVARRFVASIPDARLTVLPGAGHAPWLDDPDRCADEIRSFLR
jgi:pimeloyl-ACP methyl ester carboxylesterase